ncbi:uncharacterized protein LOC136065911 [Quercus suber]|uniref:uncharacterized protein LOC136065911 n=1 Tax=Quercus suber TaxID=58331 RepID=UPI0032DF809F
MASRFQAIPLVASPSYPNAVAWSDENLIAVASGHLVTILNPASPFGPRGLISVPNSEPFPIGVIDRKDLFSGCLLPNCLSRDRQPCVRSVSWSPLGMAPNSGCLLAVCTAEGRVKLYRPPFCDFGAEWIEVMDISDRLYEYLTSISFGELDVSCPNHSDATEDIHAEDPASFISKKERKRRKINKGSQTTGDQLPCQGNSENSNSSSGPYIEREGQGLKAAIQLSTLEKLRSGSVWVFTTVEIVGFDDSRSMGWVWIDVRASMTSMGLNWSFDDFDSDSNKTSMVGFFGGVVAVAGSDWWVWWLLVALIGLMMKRSICGIRVVSMTLRVESFERGIEFSSEREKLGKGY